MDFLFKDHDQSFIDFLNEFDNEIKKNKKKLVVLDIDNTLINAVKLEEKNIKIVNISNKIVNIINKYSDNILSSDIKYSIDEDYHIIFRYREIEKNEKGENIEKKYENIFTVQKRPYLNDFLDYIFEHYDVGVWSAGNKIYVDKNIDYIFGEKKSLLKFVYTLDNCDREYILNNNGKEILVYTKPLSKLYSAEYFYDRIIHIDDNDHTFYRNPYNALKISIWTGDKTDNQLLRCIEILKILKVSENIPTTILDHKFHLGF
jgi:TFIIF-interacting CTD phosphatase-like protein